MSDTPRIPLPRTKPEAGTSHMAFKARNSSGASITVHGLISDDAVRKIMAIISEDKKP
jgi:hypothetical protein